MVLVLNSINELDADVVEQATAIEGVFGRDEWGGCNQCLLLENGKIGVIGHGCYNEFGRYNQSASIYRYCFLCLIRKPFKYPISK